MNVRRKCKLVLAIVALAIMIGPIAIGAATPVPLTRLHSEGGYLVDGHGRVTLLRGANVPSHCYKPMTFGEADLDALAGFGFNFIRLGVSWDKSEPVEGEVDIEYVRSLVEFARLAGARGIYVMPEVHKYGWCQEGSDWPAWTCSTPVKDGDDFIAQMKNAREFWGSPELQGKLIGFWKLLVVEFRDLDNVIGYNPMNEPLDATMLVPGVFDQKLFAFYESWIKAVRELDPQRAAILEPCTANMIIPFKPPAFKHNNLVYAPHPYYIHGGDFVLPDTRRQLEKKYKRIAKEAAGLGAPLMIGEYGGDPNTEFAQWWLTRSWELQDQYFASAAIWVYGASDGGWAILDSKMTPRPFFHEGLRRPYPRHTAGRPLELKYTVAERSLIYRFEPEHGISAGTEIYLPRELATGKVTVTGGTWSYDEGLELLLVSATVGASEVVVTASP